MDFLLSLPKTMIDLSLGLLKIKKDDRTRQRLGDLLCSIAECVEAIGELVASGQHPASRCAELETYILSVHAFVADETDERTADHLTFWLKHVAEVPGISKIDIQSVVESENKPRWSKSYRFEQSEKIKEVAGMVRGVGNLVRV
jgi:hypothetical protein